MTNPVDDYEQARKQWLNRYLKVQTIADKDLRVVLIQAAEDAYKQLISLSSKKTFSASVRSAQLRLMVETIRKILDELFEEEAEIIKVGHEQAAIAAVTAFSKTDRDFLARAFSESDTNVDSYISVQKHFATVNVGHAIANVTGEDRPLSSRVYRTKALANRWVKQRVTSGITRGLSVKEIALDVRKFIKPNVSGGVSYAAMRLGRTEVNNAFHATSIALAQDRPWVEGMRWRLSKTHDFEERCKCNSYADQIFSVENVPSKPHPQCRCFVTPEVEAFDVFMRHLTAGQYRSWIRDAA